LQQDEAYGAWILRKTLIELLVQDELFSDLSQDSVRMARDWPEWRAPNNPEYFFAAGFKRLRDWMRSEFADRAASRRAAFQLILELDIQKPDPPAVPDGALVALVKAAVANLSDTADRQTVIGELERLYRLARSASPRSVQEEVWIRSAAALYLHEFKGHTQAEVARRLGLSEESEVRRDIRRAHEAVGWDRFQASDMTLGKVAAELGARVARHLERITKRTKSDGAS
jgi:hypothetical protein